MSVAAIDLQPSLFDAPAGGSVPYPGQWRLARVELANWGTFDGYHRLDVSRKGLLITGESGSGKSSLLDAVASVLTPPRALRFNAAAQSEGARGRDRTIASYVRGAWNYQAAAGGEVASAYLRAGRATWSGVLLRYECGLARDAVNLVALYHMKAGSVGDEGLSKLYLVMDGECELLQFEEHVANGIDSKGLRRACKGRGRVYPGKQHADFAAYFSQRMSMRGSKTLELLHRTQAAKNFGSLDDLFRKFMLETPATFEQRDAAVEQFQALRQAYDGVADQREQMRTLQPLVARGAELEQAQASADEAARLQAVLAGYAEQEAVAWLEQRHEELARAAECLAASLARAEQERAGAQQRYDQARAYLADAGGSALLEAELAWHQQEKRVDEVQKSRATLASELSAAGAGQLPGTEQEWAGLLASVQGQVRAVHGREQEERAQAEERYAKLNNVRQRLGDTEEELRHLRAHATNIPRRLDEVRAMLAQALGVDARELRFVGELISVRTEFSAWQGAIERVLASQAKTLLVAHDYARAAARFIDGQHLGLRFEFEDVPAAIEVPVLQAGPASLIRRVEVAQDKRHPEYTKWVNRLLREKFDYTCVGSPDELAEHRQALTIKGQVKKASRFIKDDRHRVDDQSQWVLGASNEQKVRQLELVCEHLQGKLEKAQAGVRAVEDQREKTIRLLHLGEALAGASWATYDLAAARSDLASARAFYERLSKGSAELDAAKRQEQEAKRRLQAADDALRSAQRELDGNADALAKTEEKLQQHRTRLAGCELPGESERGKLAKLFARCRKRMSGMPRDDTAPLLVANEAGQRLRAQEERAGEMLRKARNAIERVIDEYRRGWPAEAAQLGMGFEAREEYLGIYRRIESSGLPAYEQRFLNVLNEFSQDQVTVIAVTVRGAIREVKDKIALVNKSLLLSEYAPGIHLQIAVRECRGKLANEFLADLKAITENAYSGTDVAQAEKRYKLTAKVMERLQANDYEGRQWQKACLDTRQHVAFLAQEVDAQGTVVSVHDSDAGLSGGQKQKLVIFCLAAALRYQLADEDDPTPRYGTVMLDEAFDKADHRFAATAMDIFEQFGFQMVLATPMKLLQTADDHVGGVAYVHCRDRKYSTVQVIGFEDDAPAAGAAAGEEAAETGAAAVGDVDAATSGQARTAVAGAGAAGGIDGTPGHAASGAATARAAETRAAQIVAAADDGPAVPGGAGAPSATEAAGRPARKAGHGGGVAGQESLFER